MSNLITAFQLRRKFAWLTIAALLAASMLPAILTQSIVNASEVQNRFVTINSSAAASADVTYAVSFDTATPTSGAFEDLVLQYCDGSPIVGDATCGATRAFDWQSAALSINSQVGVGDWSIDLVNSTATMLILDRPLAADPGAGTTVSFTLGSGAADGVKNPTGDNSAFYIRVLTFGSAALAQAYVPGTPGTHIDDGGMALSTGKDISLTARVQERLTFCVGTVNPTAACSGISGSSVDLGVLSSGINLASVESSLIYAQVGTNAASGVNVQYVANHLDVSTCVDADANKGVNNIKTDQCLNHEVDGVTNPIVGGDEQWGIGVVGHENDGTETTNALGATTAYNSNGSTQFSFTPNAATSIATSAGVVDSEQLNIDIGGTSSVTTPTGLYTTSMTFIATSTF